MVVNVELAVLRQINVSYGFISVGLLLEAQTPNIKITARDGSVTSKTSNIQNGLNKIILYINDYYSRWLSDLLWFYKERFTQDRKLLLLHL